MEGHDRSVERFDVPGVEDGAAIWRLARDSEVLDLNSSYSYLLWCRDFADTSVVTRNSDDEVIGFVTGYHRPNEPETLVVWQVAVSADSKGRGLAGRMLESLVRRNQPRQVREVETTITPDNTASTALFTSFARRHGTGLERRVLFDGALFPDGHDSEVLFRIPLRPRATEPLHEVADDPAAEHENIRAHASHR